MREPMTHVHKGPFGIMWANLVTDMAGRASNCGLVCVEFKMDGMSLGCAAFSLN